MKPLDLNAVLGTLTGAMFVYTFLLFLDVITGTPFSWTFFFFYWDMMMILILIFHHNRQHKF